MNVKEQLQDLINQIESESELESYLNLIKILTSNKEGQLLSKLSGEQRLELDQAYIESLEPQNLIDHEVVKAKYA